MTGRGHQALTHCHQCPYKKDRRTEVKRVKMEIGIAGTRPPAQGPAPPGGRRGQKGRSPHPPAPRDLRECGNDTLVSGVRLQPVTECASVVKDTRTWWGSEAETPGLRPGPSPAHCGHLGCWGPAQAAPRHGLAVPVAPWPLQAVWPCRACATPLCQRGARQAQWGPPTQGPEARRGPRVLLGGVAGHGRGTWPTG